MLDKLTKTVGEVLDFPPDVAGKGPRITITGRQEVFVENYLEIVEFTAEEILLNTTEGVLTITGKELVLKTVLSSELRIEGQFISLYYGGGDSK
ncbi:YabP family protein [Desulfitobacterium dichloroeliminans LMG P-21439]|uniref:YabP family protein n=1 Tax=Desulfitobacterium dichloroeliminans (strain LMG P-21439 / DCA1) TaxID=871963 RepID=L0FCL6_DESDL|nr:YabP/YqfC family sporulation protein [Desulfitobacterium dichloroeliminans]AGA70401.1 YabP family protein [Desulfitobacterium dichloroeliminans LMG P-21439]